MSGGHTALNFVEMRLVHAPERDMYRLIAATAVVLLSCIPTSAEDTLEIGAVVREFYVKDVTGPAAGTELCYRCRYGNRPVVTVFTRKIDERLTAMVRELNGVVGENADSDMAGFVVLMTDDPAKHEDSLKTLVEEHEIEHLPLTIFDDAYGPRAYRLSREAEVTVMMWLDGLLVVNETFDSGDLSDEVISGVIEDTAKILN